MEISERNYFISKIRQLSLRRYKHEKIIQKLVGYQQTSTPSQNQQSNDKVQNIRNLHLNPIQNTDRSSMSCFSGLSCQVNIETYLKQKQQQHCYYRNNQIDQKSLYNSLKYVYGGDIKFQIRPDHKTTKISMVSEDSIDFTIIANFLSKNLLWEQVFRCEQNIFYANAWGQFCPSEAEVCLSTQPLSEKEKQLIVDQTKGENDSQSSLSSKRCDEKTIFIGYLLLYRLFRYMGTGFAPGILQSIFGYPYRIYNIWNTTQYFQFQNSLKQLKPNEGLLVGQSCMNGRLQELQLLQIKQNNFRQLTKRYRNIGIVYTIDGLCSKKMEVIHRRNHHSVLDIQNLQDNKVQIFISFISKSINSIFYNKIYEKCSNKCSTNINKTDTNESYCVYRYCLMGQDDQIIKYSEYFHPNKQPISLTLDGKSTYRLYISQIDNASVIDSNNSDLRQFSIVIQSQKPVTNINLELKFNQDYNKITEALINKYLKNFTNIDEVQKQMIRISQIYPQSDLLIVRTKLNFMGLVTDFICVQDHAKNSTKKLWIQYKDKEVLCDKYYKQNRKRVIITQPSIYQVYLSKISPIKSCSGLSFNISEIFL